jgi:hypothetical protein
MTLVLAFPARDGAALLTDTRKWLPNGEYLDAHQKLIRCWDGLVTGSGSGDLLDFVAERSARRLGIEVLLLIYRTTAVAREGDYAEWTISVERRDASDPAGGRVVGFQVFDGHRLRPDSWVPGNLPRGLSQGLVKRLSATMKALFAEPLFLESIRPLAVELYSEVYRSGLVSPQFDFGTHRPGGDIIIERMEV